MTEQERFQRAFAPLHAPSDTLTEVMKMTEQTHRKSGRRTAYTSGQISGCIRLPVIIYNTF